jgi:3-oxoacyl-[acyl-carrier-protein] synthase II
MLNRRRRVVITGLGVVAPNGIGKDAFWSNLIAGKSAVDYITAFDPSPYPCRVAAEVRDFVATDFMTRQHAKVMGRFSQFAVASARLAVEDASLRIEPSTSSEISIFHGTSGGGDIFETATRGLLREGPSGINPWAALEYPPHAPASYMSIELKITGPTMSLSSNCCTGLDAINLGFSSIAAHKTTIAIVGSSEAPIVPTPFGSFCSLGSLTTRDCPPDQASRPYDRLRDGLVMGEGGASLVLEDLEFALARGARIYGEVLGYSAASEAMGMRKGDLSGKVMATALSEAIQEAGLLPSDIDHVNAHGSSLPDFDICDTSAFKLALGPTAYSIPISSIKSMIGQPFSAAGTLQAVAACMSLQQQRVPPTINQEVRDPDCDLDYVPNTSRSARIRNVLLNGHSFGGSVAALVVGRSCQ